MRIARAPCYRDARSSALCEAENWQTRRPGTMRVFRIQRRSHLHAQTIKKGGKGAPFASQFFFADALPRSGNPAQFRDS